MSTIIRRGGQQRREQILSYIMAYRVVHQYSPSVREIGDAVGLSSTSTVHGHLERMRKDGLIEQKDKNPRTLRITSVALQQYVRTEQVEQWAYELQCREAEHGTDYKA